MPRAKASHDDERPIHKRSGVSPGSEVRVRWRDAFAALRSSEKAEDLSPVIQTTWGRLLRMDAIAIVIATSESESESDKVVIPAENVVEVERVS